MGVLCYDGSHSHCRHGAPTMITPSRPFRSIYWLFCVLLGASTFSPHLPRYAVLAATNRPEIAHLASNGSWIQVTLMCHSM